ncbi:hypothetical protein AUJ14_04060 [Candidatus Micrarchaeota archaeon CG1_02_55_22]|nr:MAG: hypothetical protein AUJ14_04060 [Candidatus Micrarchaeota archaeon CG1_02_55_22]
MNLEEISEFIGVIIGDGNIWAKKYEIMVAGDKSKDRAYFEYLSGIVIRNFGYTPHIRYRTGGLYLVIRSKNIFTFMSQYFPTGKRAINVFIPEGLSNKTVLRGVFDTDGSIFFSKNQV